MKTPHFPYNGLPLSPLASTYASFLVDSIDLPMIVTQPNGEIVFGNPSFYSSFGNSSTNFFEIFNYGSESLPGTAKRGMQNPVELFNTSFKNPGLGETFYRWKFKRDSGIGAYVGFGECIDHASRMLAERQLLLEREIMQMHLHKRKSLKEIADYFLQEIPKIYPGAIGSILALEGTDTLRHFSAPDLPVAYLQWIDGIKIGHGVGSCGTAAATNKVVVVTDIEQDPLWKDYRRAANEFGLKACWSVPIPHSERILSGTFAIYHTEPKVPSQESLVFIARWAQQMGILFEYHDAINDLRILRERYEISLKVTQDMLWDWNLDEEKLYRNQHGFQLLLGQQDNVFQTVQQWLDRIHPDDLPKVLDKLQLVKNGSGVDQFKINYRFLTASGLYIHLHDRGLVLKDQSGNPVRMIGATKDITEYVQFQEKLKQSEEQYRDLFERNPLPMWIFDCETYRFLQVNSTAIQQYGYTAEEFESMTIFDIRHTKDADQLLSLVKAYREETKTYDRGHWTHLTRDGKPIIVEIFSHFIIYKERRCMLVLANNITQSVELEKQLYDEKQARYKEVIQVTIEMQEKARKELSNELHDNVNQILGAAKLYLETSGIKQPRADEYRQEGILLISKAIEEIRLLCRSLTPPALAVFGLGNAIVDLIVSIQNVKPIDIHFEAIDLDPNDLDNKFQLTLYRIVQEQLNNVIKYSEATAVFITLQKDAIGIVLQISDNGIGFNVAITKRGVGLINISNRALAYDGKLLIESSPGKGCVLSVSFGLLLVRKD